MALPPPTSVLETLLRLRDIKPYEKVSVSTSGELGIEQPYPMRGIMRLIRRDGFHVTLTALKDLAIHTIVTFLRQRNSLEKETANQWFMACNDVATSLQCLNATYRKEGNLDSAEHLQPITELFEDCAFRFGMLYNMMKEEEESKAVTSLPPLPPSPPGNSDLIMIHTNNELDSA